MRKPINEITEKNEKLYALLDEILKLSQEDYQRLTDLIASAKQNAATDSLMEKFGRTLLKASNSVMTV